jgi:hypothetical protein
VRSKGRGFFKLKAEEKEKMKKQSEDRALAKLDRKGKRIKKIAVDHEKMAKLRQDKIQTCQRMQNQQIRNFSTANRIPLILHTIEKITKNQNE